MLKTHSTNLLQDVAVITFFILSMIVISPLMVHAQSKAATSQVASRVLVSTSTTSGTAQTLSQSEADMEAAIRSVIVSDPRAAALPPDQLNTMVKALAQSAEAKGLHPSDIQIPRSSSTLGGGANGNGSVACPVGTPSFLCALETAFGFDGGNLIPLWLGGTSALLVLIIGTLLEIHHLEHRKQMEAEQAMPPQTPIA